jgi:phage-related protein
MLMENHGADLRMPHLCAMGREIVTLHSFIKHTQDTPKNETAVARKRLREVRNAQ